MTRDYYSIGEVSKIMGISVQTLRYYDSIDLLKPAHVNKRTGYRYYSAEQFHIIDRIKYLQKLGMTLSDIRNVIVNNDIHALVDYLKTAKQETVSKISELTDLLDTIEWYEKYFQYYEGGEEEPKNRMFSVKHFPVRYLVVEPVRAKDERMDFHIRLTERRNNPPFNKFSYIRQYSYVLDYDSLVRNVLKPKYLGMYIKSIPEDFSDPHIFTVPEGDYFCFTARILGNQWSAYVANMYFYDLKTSPSLVVANEYENNLHEYSSCPYEVQILIPEEDRKEH
ncbi:MAG: helix-turn-helix domain-containing protein [Eubacteriales bacterium]|nr:helix-turn-helix domain-containing protein [Eubacteriales bacterium]